MQYVPLGNPIWSCQLQLLRGLRGMTATAVIYACIAYGAFIIYRKVDPTIPLSAASADAMKIGGFIQIVLMSIAGSAAIHKAVTRDHASRMIDTLRMSPLSAWQVVIGYTFGATLQMMLIWVVGVLLGLVFATIGQAGGAGDWLMGNLYLLPIAASLWALQVLFSVGHGKPFNMAALIAVVAFMMSVSRTYTYAAGTYFLTGGYSGYSAFTRMLGKQLPMEGASLAVTSAMAVFWIAAAARRFRQPHRPALDPVAAVLLLAIWCAAGVLGIAYRKAMPSTGGMPPTLPASPIVFLIFTLLAAPIPGILAMQQRRRNLDGGAIYHNRDAWPPIVTVLLTMAVVAVAAIALGRVCGAACPAAKPSAGVYSAIALSLATLAAFGVIKAMYCAFNKLILVSFLALLFWAGPPIADHLFLQFSIQRNAIIEENYTLLFTTSPVGVFFASWTGITPSIAAGLLVQAFLAAVSLMIAYGFEQRHIAFRKLLKRREAEEDSARTRTHPAPAASH